MFVQFPQYSPYSENTKLVRVSKHTIKTTDKSGTVSTVALEN